MMSRRWWLAAMAAMVLVQPVRAMDLREADALYEAGKWAEASAAYDAVIPNLDSEQRGKALARRGYALERDNQPDAAIASYQQAIDDEGSTGQTRGYATYRMGSVLYVPKRELEKSLATLLRVPTIDGAHPATIAEAYLIASSVAIKLDDEQQALEILGRIEKVVSEQGAPPHSLASAWLRMGRILTNRKDYAGAADIYRKVVNLKGSSSKQRAYAGGYLAELELLAQGDLPFYIQPYVTNVSHDGAQLIWITQGEFDGRVTLKPQAGGEPLTFTPEASPVKATQCFRQTAELSGLQAGAAYQYTVQCGDETREGSFRVNPMPGEDVEVVIGVTGDTQAAPDIHLAVAKIIGAADPDFMIHVGDLTDHGSTWSKWREELFEPGMPYMRKCAFWPAVGNHDGGPYFGILFHRGRKMWWSFDYGPVHVAILDSYWWGSSRRGGRAEQLKWLEEDLAASKATWKIVALHVPMIATRAELQWWGHEDFLPVMERAGVDMVLSGHHPMYRKYLPLSDPQHKPIYHVTTGGGGPTGAPMPSPILEVGSAYPHASVIRIKGNQLELTATQTDGSVIDRFVMAKQGAGYQAEIMDKAVPRDVAWKTRHIYHELLDERSNQLVLDVEQRIEPGWPARFVLDTTRLPRGALPLDQLPPDTKFIIGPAPSSQWQGEESVLPMDQSRLAFNLIAPKQFTFGGGKFDPPLLLEMNLQVGERRLQPMIVTARLSTQAAQRLAAQTGGLPSVWDFRFDPDDVGVKEKWFAQIAPGDWKPLAITNWWEKQLNVTYDGVGWYRAKAEIEKPAPGRRVWLMCGPIDESVSVYVNQQHIATQIYDTHIDDSAWEKPRRFDITDAVKPGDNLFALRVQDLFGMGGMYGGAVIVTEPANLLTGGGMTDAPKGWQISDGEGAMLSAANAKYVGEHALHIENRSNWSVTMTRTFDVAGLVDAVQSFARVKVAPIGHAHPHDADPMTIELFRGASLEAEPFAAINVTPDTPDTWTTLRAAGRLLQDDKVTVRITLRQPGLYLIDELGVTAAE